MSRALYGKLLALAVALATTSPPAVAQAAEERLEQHRNLGKAFYENPATQYEAVGELRKALELAPDSARERVNYGLALLRAGQVPEGLAELERAQKQDTSIPHTWFNLGIAYKQASRYAEALQQLEKMAELVPDEPITQYNLGVLYKLEGRIDEAIRHWQRAAELDPNLAGPHFQLATAYRQARRADDSRQAMARFRELKRQNEGAAFPEDLEWSYYSELYDVIDPANAAGGGTAAAPRFAARELASGLDSATAGLDVIDIGGDRKPDLLAWSSAGLAVHPEGGAASAAGLAGVSDVLDVAAGDYDDDGLVDLAISTGSGAALYRQSGGAFQRAPVELPAGRFSRVLWLDYDHDYDLDLFLLGASPRLWRNQGGGSWSDRTADFPFVAGEPTAAVVLDVVADVQGADLAVAFAARPGVVYRDRLGGRYEAVPTAAIPAGTRSLAARDADSDGWTDLLAVGSGRASVLLNDTQGSFRAAGPGVAATAAAWLDYENRGLADLVGSSGVHRNLGLGRLGEALSPAGWSGSLVALATADFDGDGSVDVAGVDTAGALRLLSNQTTSDNRWLSLSLEGTKNAKLAPGSEVEVRAGTSYQKSLYTGAPLHFGLGGRGTADTVRITWPNGLIQNETRQQAGQHHHYVEAQRLSGSCPMIYTWNGEEFEFITDVLGVAPLGASAGDGEYFPVDHDEVIQIAGESLQERDGHYEIRIVEELREVAFLDEIRLVAVDHPAEVEIFTNDKFKGPPFPEFRLFGVDDPVPPVAARDHRGADVLDRVLELDRRYPDGFDRDMSGVAELHHIDLDFGDAAADGRAVLVLSGWVDWADGSTFLAAAQAGGPGLVMPALQVRDESGEWRTVIEDMGIPAGKPKTIVVDLTDVFLSSSREIRIVTNLCVYWDRIFLSEDVGEPEIHRTDMHAAAADLRFRGFSEVVVHPERRQPEHFVYANVQATAMWNPTPGMYTRYGDVRPLLGEIDDRLVVMGSGDEVRLLFDAAALPGLPGGWRRDFLLVVDGWAKDGDANTAHSQTVGPLPYHGMPQYPYAPPDAYPTTDEHRLYLEHYLTRPALKLIRPLTEGLAMPGAEE